MGFSIGSVVSEITSVVTDPGKLVSQIADSVLPSSMKALGDMLGGIVDLNTGHPLQALGHLGDTLKDLPQLLQGQAGAQARAAATPAGTAGAEPSAPPTRGTQTVTTGNATPAANAAPAAGATPAPNAAPAAGATPAPNAAPAAGATPAPNAAPAAGATPAPNAAPATGATPAPNAAPAAGATPPLGAAPTVNAAPAANGATPPATAQPEVTLSVNLGNGRTLTISENLAPGVRKPALASSMRQVIGHPHRGRVVGLPRGPAQRPATSPSITITTSNAAAGTTASATPPAGSTTIAAATGATSTAPSTASTATSATSAPAAGASSTAANTSSAASSTGTPSSLASLLALSPDQFMQAVTSGNIPPDVANNPSAMAQIQARMNQITQMNQLLTSMMAAMHQMQMSIIQNIRC